jgi:hypothetical protein
MATTLGPTAVVVSQGVYDTSTVQNNVLGEKAFSNDGRTFRYVQVGAVALVPGNYVQSPAIVTNHVNLTPTALPSLGDTVITATLGATAATLNQYAFGTVTIEKGTLGVGQTLLIKGHAAVASSGVITLNLSDAVQTTVTGTVTISLAANPYLGVIQAPVTTLTGVIVGVAISPLAAAAFGWICTRGITGTLIVGTPAVGSAVGCPTTTAGAATVDAATLQHVGTVMKTAITGQVTPTNITID